MTVTAVSSNEPFARTRVTWLLYGLMMFFAFSISLVGPMMPFVADKMNLTYTQMGYHFALLAAGGLVGSVIGDGLARRIGNATLAWSAAVLTCLALPGVIFGTVLNVTLFSVSVYGVGIGLLSLIVIAAITDNHPRHSAKAYTEGNICAGTGVVIGPILVGLFAKTAPGWQMVTFLPAIALVLVVVIFRKTPFPSSPEETRPTASGETQHIPLPRLFWFFGVLMALSIGIEWLVSSWSASFLSTVVGYDPSTAASLVSVFAIAIVLGRMIGRRLLEWVSEARLLLLSLAWVVLMFPLYWLGELQVLNVIGLFFVGVGVGNLAPLSQSGAMVVASAQTNRASARLGMFVSVTNLMMLQFVGVLADRIGIQSAYATVIVVTVVAIAVAVTANRLRAQAA